MSDQSEPPVIGRLVQIRLQVEKALLDLGHARQCEQQLGATIVARIEEATENASPELPLLEEQIGALFCLREWHHKFIDSFMDLYVSLTEIFYEWSFLNTKNGLLQKNKQARILRRASEGIALGEKLISNLVKVFNADYSQLSDMPGLQERAITYAAERNAKNSKLTLRDIQ